MSGGDVVAQQSGGRWPLSVKAQTPWQPSAAAMVLAAVVIFALGVAVLPPTLVVPAFALAAFVCGAAFALFGWMTGRPQQADRITCWDIASTCVFVGFAAGVLSDPGHVMDLTPLSRER
jgi:hypothetical protein